MQQCICNINIICNTCVRKIYRCKHIHPKTRQTTRDSFPALKGSNRSKGLRLRLMRISPSSNKTLLRSCRPRLVPSNWYWKQTQPSQTSEIYKSIPAFCIYHESFQIWASLCDKKKPISSTSSMYIRQKTHLNIDLKRSSHLPNNTIKERPVEPMLLQETHIPARDSKHGPENKMRTVGKRTRWAWNDGHSWPHIDKLHQLTTSWQHSLFQCSLYFIPNSFRISSSGIMAISVKSLFN